MIFNLKKKEKILILLQLKKLLIYRCITLRIFCLLYFYYVVFVEHKSLFKTQQGRRDCVKHAAICDLSFIIRNFCSRDIHVYYDCKL